MWAISRNQTISGHPVLEGVCKLGKRLTIGTDQEPARYVVKFDDGQAYRAIHDADIYPTRWQAEKAMELEKSITH